MNHVIRAEVCSLLEHNWQEPDSVIDLFPLLLMVGVTPEYGDAGSPQVCYLDFYVGKCLAGFP